MRVGDDDDAIFISIHAQAQGSFPGLFILRKGSLLLIHRCRVYAIPARGLIEASFTVGA